MTDPFAPQAPQAPPPITPLPRNDPFSDERQMAMLVYIFYLGAFVFAPLGIAGLVLAYINRDTAPDWLKSHYTFQIYTFWISVLFWAVSILLCFVLIGFFLILAVIAWQVIRCALGINRLIQREPYPNPTTWIT